MKSLRLLAVIVATVLFVAGLSACAPSHEERLQSRWGNFVTMLPAAAKGALDQGDYVRAADLIDSALITDTAFASRWSDMKKAEAIELFSTSDVIDYFVTHFGAE